MIKNSKTNFTHKISPIIIYILLWLLVNLTFLTDFPFIHSDEIWLSGLTKTMMEKGTVKVTEPFFDLVPRTVHGMRIIFHGLNSIFIKIFGYTPLGIRFLPLICGALGLFIFFMLCRRTGTGRRTAFAGTVLLSADIQYIYSSHFGRQEMLLVVFMLSAIYFLSGLTVPEKKGRYTGILAGIFTGAALGIHPYALITGLPSLILISLFLIQGRISRKVFAGFLTSAFLSAFVFVGITFVLNSDFLTEYAAFSKTVGVRSGAGERLAGFFPYFKKLFLGISGTYFTPEIKIQLLLLPVVLFSSILFIVFSGNRINKQAFFTGISGVTGILLGIIAVGKYSQPSVIFLFPFIYILLTSILSLMGSFRQVFKIFIAAGAVLLALTSIYNTIYHTLEEQGEYAGYINALEELVPEGSVTVSDITAAPVLGPSNFRDWRNLALLQEKSISLSEYLSRNGIEYIVLPEELEYIYNSRPVWNMMYGNLHPWYPQLLEFLENKCSEKGVFISPSYGTRITALRHRKDWRIRVYEVLPPSISE